MYEHWTLTQIRKKFWLVGKMSLNGRFPLLTELSIWYNRVDTQECNSISRSCQNKHNPGAFGTSDFNIFISGAAWAPDFMDYSWIKYHAKRYKRCQLFKYLNQIKGTWVRLKSKRRKRQEFSVFYLWACQCYHMVSVLKEEEIPLLTSLA